MFARIVTKSTTLAIGGESVVKSVNISEKEHFKIMCQVFDEVINQPEHKNEAAKEALIVFSNAVHKKMFQPQKQRLYVTPRVERIATEVLAGK